MAQQGCVYVGRILHVISLKSSDLRSPRQGKALMISGSHEICTACRSRLPCFTEPHFALPPNSPLSLLTTSFSLLLATLHCRIGTLLYPCTHIFSETSLTVTLHHLNLFLLINCSSLSLSLYCFPFLFYHPFVLH